MFWYVKYISTPCCLVCSLLLKQVGNKGKLLPRTFFLKSFRLRQQVSKLFLKLSLQTLFTRKTCYEAKHITTVASSGCGFLSIFHKAQITASKAQHSCKPPCIQFDFAPYLLRYYIGYFYAQEKINLYNMYTETKYSLLQYRIEKNIHIKAESSRNTSVQILNSMASRVALLYPHYNGLIMCYSIKLLAFWILFQFSWIPITQSITICLQVKVVSLNLQRYHFQSSTAIQKHIIRNMKHFLLLLLHHRLNSSPPM